MNLALVSDRSREVDDAFAAVRAQLPGTADVAARRDAAYAEFATQGLPHRRVEDWKYTDLRRAMPTLFPVAAAPSAAAIAKAKMFVAERAVEGALTIVLLDGVVVPELSDARHVTLCATLHGGNAQPLHNAKSDAMLALNAAMATDGAVLTLDGNAKVQLLRLTSQSRSAAATRSHIRVADDATITLVETIAALDGADGYQSNDALIVSIGEGARFHHVRIMEDARDAVGISSAIVDVGTDATYNFFTITSGGRVSRYQSFITMAGENGSLTANGVNLLNGAQHGDTTLVVDHAVPNCTSRETFRAVLDDRAHSVFQGKIIVRPHAQKTDGKMMTRALLLSDEAEADNKPELEIFADDVTCGHGATVGALDESLLFYLRARGLNEREAQALLIQAFVGEAIEGVADDTVRETIMSAAERWLKARG